MKMNGTINGINIQKTGVKITFILEEENKEYAMQTLAGFVDRPITLEMLVNAKQVLEDANKISEEQRKKIYILITEFANEYGESPEGMKGKLKEWFLVGSKHQNFSLSDCSNELANDFIEFILQTADKQNYAIGSEYKEKTDTRKQMLAAIKNKSCVVCNETARVYGGESGRISLCDTHSIELKENPSKFLEKYHLELV